MVPTIFDFNGVLVDDESVHLAAFREVLRPLGVTIDDATYAERYLGFDDAGAFRAILTDAGQAPTEVEIARLIAAKKPVYMELIGDALVVFEGAPEIVRRRANIGPVGIVSGALRTTTSRIGMATARAARPPSASTLGSSAPISTKAANSSASRRSRPGAKVSTRRRATFASSKRTRTTPPRSTLRRCPFSCG